MSISITKKLMLGAASVGSLLAAWAIPSKAFASENAQPICDRGDEFVHRRLGGDQIDEFCQTYKGKVILVVNTASKCAFTPQYDGLEKLYSEYRDKGLVVVGFPSNDFGNQEPGTEENIKKFCRLTYGVNFPMYAKTVVKGSNASPLYKALYNATGDQPRWNFHKYLINREGQVVGSYSSFTKPQSRKLIGAIEHIM